MSGFSINTWTVSGNLTRDPELRSTQGGTSVCSLRIAHNDRYKDSGGEWRDRSHFFDVSIWGGMGEWVANNLEKGMQVVVSGRAQWREWEKDGNKRQAVQLVADSIVPVDRKENGRQRSDAPPDDDFQPAPATSTVDDDVPS